MKTYTKFLINGFIKSFLNVFFVMISLVFILNILQEIEFFNSKEVNALYPVYLSVLNSPSIIFEMFPFIFLLSTQFFFLKLFNNDEINIFKYSGLKNTKIINILSFVSFLIGTIAMFENAGRARAASELARMGRYDEAKSLMMEIKNAKNN